MDREGDVVTDARDEPPVLAAEIRKHIAPADDHVPEGYWWYDGGRDGELPEALAADLLAAGWRAPVPDRQIRATLDAMES